jgi:PST family polysaccharide transporter/lipopolysaccharide exporter
MRGPDSGLSAILDSLRRTLRERLGGFVPAGSIAERTAKSGVWVARMNVSDRVLQLLMVLVVARLLDPRDFGLFGIAVLAVGASKQLTNIGLNAALIQQKSDDVDSYLNTVWFLEIARGAVIAAVLFLAAPSIASFFGEPRTTELLRVVAISPLLVGLKNPGIVYFNKDLQFHKRFVYQVSGSLALFLLAVGYALVYADVWALIIGFVAADVTRLCVSYLVHDYRPRPEFDLSHAKELISYGKWMTGNSILLFLYGQGDDAVIGWLLPASALGFYQLAYRFSNAPATEIASTIAKVTFPLYSKLQDDTEGVREAFFRAMQVTTFVAFPAAFGIAAVAPTFVEAFLGEQWLPVVTTMQLLAAYGLTRTLGKTFGAVWKATGRPDLLTKLPIIRIALLAAFIYPATTRFGIEGTAFLIVATSVFPMMPINVYLVVNSIETTYRRFLYELAYPLIASATMGLAVVFVRDSVVLPSPILEFFLLVGTGIATYAVAVAALDLSFDWGISENVRSIREAL